MQLFSGVGGNGPGGAGGGGDGGDGGDGGSGPSSQNGPRKPEWSLRASLVGMHVELNPVHLLSQIVSVRSANRANILVTMSGCAAARSSCSVMSSATLKRQAVLHFRLYRSNVLLEAAVDAFGYVGPGQLADD